MKYTLGIPTVDVNANNANVKARLGNREFVPLRRSRDDQVILAFTADTSGNTVSVRGLVISEGSSGNKKGVWYTGYDLSDFVEYHGVITLEN